MSHILNVYLVSSVDGNLTFTKQMITNEERSTSLAYELCRKAEALMNEDKFHSKLAPWKIISSKWEA